jgi:outer membrane lipoprotein SlyB
MTFHQTSSRQLLAACVMAPLALAPVAAAAQPGPQMEQQQRPGQPQRYASPAISGFDVQQARQLRPGTEMVFTLYGTPGGDARISIDGIRGQFALPEVEPGMYVGSYTVRTADRLSPQSMVTANLRLGNQVASAVLDESLQAGAPWRSQAGSVPSGLAPRIERFSVAPNSRIEPGSELLFSLQGTPGGKASVRVNGLQGKIFLDETAPGRYQGDYTIRSRDRIAPGARVTASLRAGDRETTSVLREPLVAANAVRPPNLPPRVCANCGVVEAINAIEVKGDGSYLGLVGGGVAGAVLGSQVGNGNGRTAAQLLGAVGGALAGREVEKNVRRNTHYEVVTRLESGGVQTINYAAPPPLRVGDRVRVEGNALVAN